MNVSRKWLEAFLRRPLEARELAERLALLGAPADAVVPLHGELSGIVVAEVESVRPHPNSDRLNLCVVNDGTPERRHVVCGASNVTAGHKYPFARVGRSLPGGITIERRKIRGETSEGMLCSSRELGLGTEHEGIMTLETDAPPGAPFLQAIGIDDDLLELDITPVRPDLLGHKGVARELAAAYGTTWRLPEIPICHPPIRPSAHSPIGPSAHSPIGPSAHSPIGPSAHSPIRPSAHPTSIRPTHAATGTTAGVAVSIDPASSCARFTAAVIRGITVGPSPEWLRRRIESVGQRSINNVVDATNYVMLELGQPLHAYDLARLHGPALSARPASPGERLVTLDGVDRPLDSGTTVIADATGPVGVAGVMGGQGSEISDATTDLVLECAWFAPAPTRRARKAVGLSTDASQRFERGTDLWAVPDALRRCIEVIIATAGGTLEGEPLDLWPEPKNPPRIFLRTARCTQVLGAALPLHVIEQCLVAIGATMVAKPAEGRLAVEAPGWRPDIKEEIDLIEEVARVHGYGSFPDDLRPFRAGNQADAPMEVALGHVKRGMAAEGLLEAILLPIGPRDDADAVEILNPLSAEHGFLRKRLLPGLVRQVEANWANQVRDVRLFETGTAFQRAPSGPKPVETTRVAAVITGGRHPAHWTESGKAPDVDLWDLKGLFERAVSLAHPGASVQVEREGWSARLPDGREVGSAGLLQADAPPWAGALYGFELEVSPEARAPQRYAAVPAIPAATRDLALLLPEGVTVAAVIESVKKSAGTLLEVARVTDEYRGAGVPAGKRSVVLHLVLRGRDRTLRDSDVDAILSRVLKQLGETLDVTLRSA